MKPYDFPGFSRWNMGASADKDGGVSKKQY
jgi:hypothetical protein